ncbi:MAG: hypothetical protein ACI4U3_10410 [Traorella sp.]
MNRMKSILIQIGLGILIGLGLGILMLFVFDESFFDNYGFSTLVYLLIMVFISFILQIIFHEAGHLLFGYLAGFKFVSFRIGSYIITKEDQKFKLGRYHLQNTAGQCLMEPSLPNYKNYLLYNLGGGIVNLAVSLLFLILGILNHDLLFDIFCFSLLSVGIFLGLTNLIPLDVGIPNDGYNAYWMSKDKSSIQALYQQLMISKELASGKKMSELEKDLIEIGEDAQLNNPLNMCIAVNQTSYLIYNKQYEEALDKLKKMNNVKTSRVFKEAIMINLLLIELLTSENPKIDLYMDSKLKKKFQNDKNDIDSLLVQYGIDLLINQDEKASLVDLKYFNDACKSYPYQGIVQEVKELQKKLEERKVIYG